MDPAPPEPMFRASKRRKVMRKRANDDSSDQASSQAPISARPTDIAVALSAPETSTYQERVTEEEQGGPAEQVLRQRKPLGARKRGIGFSNSITPRASATDDATEAGSSAMVPTETTVEFAASRFVAPTGHVAITDDRHM